MKLMVYQQLPVVFTTRHSKIGMGLMGLLFPIGIPLGTPRSYKTDAAAASLALNAGSDMDMESGCYVNELKTLLKVEPFKRH